MYIFSSHSSLGLQTVRTRPFSHSHQLEVAWRALLSTPAPPLVCISNLPRSASSACQRGPHEIRSPALFWLGAIFNPPILPIKGTDAFSSSNSRPATLLSTQVCTVLLSPAPASALPVSVLTSIQPRTLVRPGTYCRRVAFHHGSFQRRSNHQVFERDIESILTRQRT